MRGTRKAAWPGRLLLLGWVVLCVAAIAVMWRVVDTRFEPPPPSPSQWPQWWSQRDPLDAAAALCRLATTVALGYLAAAGTALLVSSLVSYVRLVRLAQRLNPAPVAGLVTLATLAGGPVASAEPTPAGAPEADGVSMTMVADLPTMELLEGGADEPAATGQARNAASVDPAPAADPTVVQVPGSELPDGASDQQVEVRPGDHLWGLAQQRLALALGRRPSESEVRGYWLALIAANADRLVEPGNPDLILPGQVLRLPG